MKSYSMPDEQTIDLIQLLGDGAWFYLFTRLGECTMDTTGTELVHVDGQDIIPQLDPTTRQPRIWTSIDRKDDSGKALYLKCKGNADRDPAWMEQNMFSIQHVLLQHILLTNKETGEINPATRTVLIDPNGQTVAFVSDGIVEAIVDLCSPDMYGKPPWSPPLRMKLKVFLTASKRRRYDLIPAIPGVIRGSEDESEKPKRAK